jgi:hypothetical protein
MGRPIGSVNKAKPFTDMLRVALLSGDGRRLRVIADKLTELAEAGDLQAIKEIADRLDGKSVQAIERGEVRLEDMSDGQLLAIARGGSREPLDEPSYARICGPFPANNHGRGAQRLGTDLGTADTLINNYQIKPIR